MTESREFDVLLFDLGGVLIDFAGFDELSRLMPGTLSREQIRDRWIQSSSVQLFERGGTDPQSFAEGVIDELGIALSTSQFLAEFVAWARGPYPGALSLLKRIKKNLQVACLSNSNQLHTPLHRKSVESFMQRYYFSDELEMVKPDPEIFQFVVRDLGVPAHRIAFFDDTSINVEAAVNQGLGAFHVDGLEELAVKLQSLGCVD